MNYELIQDFYLKSTPEEKCQFLWLIADHISIPISAKDKEGKEYVDCLELDRELPVVMNGTFYQFNTEKLFKK